MRFRTRPSLLEYGLTCLALGIVLCATVFFAIAFAACRDTVILFCAAFSAVLSVAGHHGSNAATSHPHASLSAPLFS